MRPSSLVLAIEQLWCALQHDFPELPDVQVGLYPKDGYYGYAVMDQSPGWLLITTEAIEAGPQQILATVLHEAVHFLANERGVVDTFGADATHHTLAFAELATTEFGLKVEWQDNGAGWSTVKVRRRHRRKYRPYTQTIQQALREGDPTCVADS